MTNGTNPATLRDCVSLLFFPSVSAESRLDLMLRYCRNVRPTWVKFDSKDTKESGEVFEILSTKFTKGT